MYEKKALLSYVHYRYFNYAKKARKWWHWNNIVSNFVLGFYKLSNVSIFVSSYLYLKNLISLIRVDAQKEITKNKTNKLINVLRKFNLPIFGLRKRLWILFPNFNYWKKNRERFIIFVNSLLYACMRSFHVVSYQK